MCVPLHIKVDAKSIEYQCGNSSVVIMRVCIRGSFFYRKRNHIYETLYTLSVYFLEDFECNSGHCKFHNHIIEQLVIQGGPLECTYFQLYVTGERLKIEPYGSVLMKHGGGRRTSDEMVANVQAAYERNPRKSLRRASRELQEPKSTLQQIVHKRLKLYAYKVQLMQRLEPDDKSKSVEFANTIFSLGLRQR
ncbi:hypothetical protein ANN_20933 [Periplaneta americana]|uniref:Uncharacterized protein n=1 Tax=Periplaneta americana TaxID=6978 RepID=A0ABQ8SE06_PERAM|nr:hypothetical protein ANN_20933 [Periplaneta americana]